MIIGDRVFVGGSFANARPANAAPGVNTVPRSNLMSYSLSTGEMTSFAPKVNGQVRALAVSADGSTLYVGGQFTTINGSNRFRLAAFNISTGALTPFARISTAQFTGWTATTTRSRWRAPSPR